MAKPQIRRRGWTRHRSGINPPERQDIRDFSKATLVVVPSIWLFNPADKRDGISVEVIGRSETRVCHVYEEGTGTTEMLGKSMRARVPRRAGTSLRHGTTGNTLRTEPECLRP